MPHISPMSWIITPILFIFLMLLFITTTWWLQTASFPYMKLSTKAMNPKWNWN